MNKKCYKNRVERIDTESGACRPVCGLHACHVLTGRSLKFVERWFRNYEDYGISPRGMYRNTPYGSPNWRGGTRTTHVLEFIRKYKKVKKFKHQSKTVMKFVEDETTKKDMFLIHVANHFLTVVNQKVADQNSVQDPRKHWCARNRLKGVWKVGVR